MQGMYLGFDSFLMFPNAPPSMIKLLDETLRPSSNVPPCSHSRSRVLRPPERITVVSSAKGPDSVLYMLNADGSLGKSYGRLAVVQSWVWC